MKNKSAMVLAVVILAAGNLMAQEFKVPKNSGRLEINIGRVRVEGHNGNEIIFSSSDGDRDNDERAQGLRSINSLGLDDNTKLGINVTQDGEVVRVQQLKKNELTRYKDSGPSKNDRLLFVSIAIRWKGRIQKYAERDRSGCSI